MKAFFKHMRAVGQNFCATIIFSWHLLKICRLPKEPTPS